MTNFSLKPIVETILFASENPLNAGEILKVIERVRVEASKIEDSSAEELSSPVLEESASSVEDQLLKAQQTEEEKLSRSDIQQVINLLVEEYEQNSDRGFVLVNVAQGFQFRTRQELAPYLRAMNQVSPTRLSQAAMETLAMVAYRQPITRAEVDEIRGVESGGVLKTLLDRDLVRIVGKKDEPGKPILYGTTDIFLQVFNLRSLQDLPTLKDLAQIEEEMKRQTADASETVVLEEDFFQEEEVLPSFQESVAERFEVLEKEEEEALQELDQEIEGLKILEEKVVQTLNPSTPELPAVEGIPSSSSSSDSAA